MTDREKIERVIAAWEFSKWRNPNMTMTQHHEAAYAKAVEVGLIPPEQPRCCVCGALPTVFDRSSYYCTEHAKCTD